ncbi:hypothetical protein QYM36_006417, partial [Artemia franciscana]
MITIPQFGSSPSFGDLLKANDMPVSKSNGPSRQSSNASICSVSGLTDYGPSTSQFFEVFYVGKIKVSHERAPETFTDDALGRFRAHEAQKRLKYPSSSSTADTASCRTPSTLLRSPSFRSSVSPESSLKDHVKFLEQGLNEDTSARKHDQPSDDEIGVQGVLKDPLSLMAEELKLKKTSENDSSVNGFRDLRLRSHSGSFSKDLERPRVSSTSSVDGKHGHEQNRTMLFEIGRYELRLISPDQKSRLLTKPIKDLTFVSQGIKSPEHFGFICREVNCETYVGYLFKCQSPSIAAEILAPLKQAVTLNVDLPPTGSHLGKSRTPSGAGNCEQSPCAWYQKLMVELDGLPLHRVRSVLMNRIESLPEKDCSEILTKVEGAEPRSVREEIDLLLLLLKAHCESKHQDHYDDSQDSRQEFLSHVLERSSGAILQKAKKSIATSIDHLRKKKTEGPERALSLTDGISIHIKNASPIVKNEKVPNFINSPALEELRPRSSTVSSCGGELIKKELRNIRLRKTSSNLAEFSEPDASSQLSKQEPTNSPLFNIFMKVGSPAAENQRENLFNTNKPENGTPQNQRSWRQAIFAKVASSAGERDEPKRKRTKEEWRSLWKWAIHQQLLLIRMNKENKRLKLQQEEAMAKRQKLEYVEIPPATPESEISWNAVLSKDLCFINRCDLEKALKAGIPKQKRGEAWKLLIDYNINYPEQRLNLPYGQYSITSLPQENVPYEDLICQLTSFQHLILIDLSRTFPKYSYYSAFMGPGQLALYNLLKAYSLLDTEVGYCQGLSFIAGVILLHGSEQESFSCLKHLLITKGLRSQFLPGMMSIQVQLYQFDRLLHDNMKDLFDHLERNDIVPIFYASPWFLTIFASQFPLGFVVRVFDLIFLYGIEAIFRVSLALLAEHREMLIGCRNQDQLMDYFKSVLPAIGASEASRVFSQAVEYDLSRQLATYEIEYYVLQEEVAANSSHICPTREENITAHRLEKQLKNLQAQLDVSKLSNKEKCIQV